MDSLEGRNRRCEREYITWFCKSSLSRSPSKTLKPLTRFQKRDDLQNLANVVATMANVDIRQRRRPINLDCTRSHRRRR
ncbi:uncharacterized protein LACBIDRAFT_298482 [Laccaria bicolor S238N-H82]|uniref:Predicted protein n=1 Tax=Laccaria bicolor (strain S238N-H82 / ATCC MYA-4686) TaxID=486041 RepID=B0DCY8_LACBS|nr:uncharacterized protein LACBIDRAFT_298482 [Laccaria bicolor S238N-H82]EDR07519.1 predicted protein [Laccaria bicolor S238N-H82]|eukprot:XP_001881911.1 predicted protein [Laccaria bicolor S238N-H82]